MVVIIGREGTDALMLLLVGLREHDALFAKVLLHRRVQSQLLADRVSSYRPSEQVPPSRLCGIVLGVLDVIAILVKGVVVGSDSL